MRIAQVSATFPPYMAGTGNVCYHYAIELAKLGHEVTVFTSRYPDEEYMYPDIITVKRFKPLFRIGNAPFIPQLLREIKDFDIVHLHYPFFFGGEIIYFIKKLKNIPYVITYHNDVSGEGIKGIYFKLYNKTVAKQIIYNASKIFALSEDYVRNSNLNEIFISKRKDIVILPNGVDTERFNPKLSSYKEEILARYNLSPETPIILFVAALDAAHTFKGLPILLTAFSKIIEKTDAYLIIVGDGELKLEYMKLARNLGVSQRTIFAGKVPAEDLPKYYALSEFLVLPSTGIENFPLVVLEAMASGKPVIASSLPGVRRVVNDGIDGILVPPKDTEKLSEAIEYMLNNETIKKKMGKNARKKIEQKYSWKKIVEKLEKVYKSI